MFYLTFVYAVTFCVFPGVTNYTNLTFLGKDSRWKDILFVTAFNGCDTLGRFAGGQKFALTKLPKTVFVLLCYFRVLQIGAFFIFAFRDGALSTFTDILKIANTVTFAFLNGYLQTICGCKAPTEVGPEDQEAVGYLVGLLTNVGIFLGSVI